MAQIVSVFGSGQVAPDSADYADAVRLGGMLAEAGYIVMTGGYAGLMEAASKGAKEAGGHVIGVTVGMFDRAGAKANDYVDEVMSYDTLSERLLHVVKAADAVITLPGGIGTLTEVALTWSLLQTGEVAPMPFVLVGDIWQTLMEGFYGAGSDIREPHMHLFQLARTPHQALTMLRNWEVSA